MGRRRRFKVVGETLVDVYGLNSAGKPVSFHVPIAAFARPRSPKPPLRPRDPPLRALVQRRNELRKRLETAPLRALTSADFIDVARLRPVVSGTLIQKRFGEMVRAWRMDDAPMLACAAGALLALNPCHTEAARELTSILFAEDVSTFVRTMAASHLSGAFQPAVESKAMSCLRDALATLIEGSARLRWGPFAYTCAQHMMRLDPKATLRLFRRELRERDEHDRRNLIMELAGIPDARVARLLLKQTTLEESTRARDGVRRRVTVRAVCRHEALGADTPRLGPRARGDRERERAGPLLEEAPSRGCIHRMRRGRKD
jgi:hypothetical protein